MQKFIAKLLRELLGQQYIYFLRQVDMLESVATNDKLTFADLSEEEKQKRGILGRLYGPCAGPHGGGASPGRV